MTNPENLRAEVRAERTRLADLLADAPPASWAADSLCTGWRVREAVAHLTFPYRSSGWQVLRGVLAAGFSFNRYADRAARADTAVLSDQQLLGCLRDNAGHPWTPPGGGVAGALSHDVIHGLDITEPLGLPAPPPERIALVLRSGSARQLRYFGVDLAGHRLEATDAEVAVGHGTPLRLAAKDVLLVVTGRLPLPAASAS